MRQLRWGPASESLAELISLEFWDLGAVAIQEVQHGVDSIELVVGFDSDAQVDRALELIQDTRAIVIEDDGRNAWKAFATAYDVGDRITIVPTWIALPPLDGDGRDHVVIDPGDDFGLNHITTRTCLQTLSGLVVPGASVLDVGCGTGVLSVVAAKFGAARVVAIDISESAVATTRANAERNHVTEIVEARCCELHDVVDAFEPFDVVVANLGGTLILVELADALQQCCGATEPGGMLLLSGMLASGIDEVVRAFSWREAPRTWSIDNWGFVVGTPST